MITVTPAVWATVRSEGGRPGGEAPPTIVWQRLIDRVVGLDDAAVLLPGFDRASPAGMTMIDPLHG
ncbi:hypothetical protein [Streptomyces sp. E-08]|uniref:hypothetical protein n=1 Tax=Streptomyces sp. E-08 TaxID=3404047 RepID=UPI003CEE5DA4